MIYSNRRQPTGKSAKSAWIVGGVLSFVAVSLAILFFFSSLGILEAFPFGYSRDDAELIRLWNADLYGDVLDRAETTLTEQPLHGQSLTFGGFAGFYLGVDSIDEDDQRHYLDRSIRLLRRALHVPRAPLRAEREYVIAKAYYHTGELYMDLAVMHMLASIDLGYIADDTEVYLAMAYASLRQHDESVIWFERAIKRAEALEEDLDANALRMTAAASYEALGRYEDAEAILREAITRLDDEYVILVARNRLASLLILMEEYARAELLLQQTIEEHGQSADAHYYLGVVYDRTQRRVEARDQWRTARRIDPNHTDSLLSLAN